jgi:hypothetical protein
MPFYSLVLKLSRNSSKQFDVYTSEANSDPALRETLSRLAPYIRDYVQNAFGTEASEQEYIERIFARLEGQFGSDTAPQKVEATVLSYLRSLVQNDRRTIDRAVRRHTVTAAEMESVRDSNSLSFDARLQVQSELRAYLECLPPDQQELLKAAYGVNQEIGHEEIDRATLAKMRGKPQNTINQQVCRSLESIRDSAINQALRQASKALARAAAEKLTPKQKSLSEKIRVSIDQAQDLRSRDTLAALKLARRAFQLTSELLRILEKGRYRPSDGTTGHR